MANLFDESKTEEVSKDFRYVVDDRCYTKQCWGSSVILKNNVLYSAAPLFNKPFLKYDNANSYSYPYVEVE
jgi:hypothetical protein